MSLEVWPLVVLGLYHGVNPAMGWLFAVALGLQERRRSAVLRALPFIALGHEASVAVVVALVSGLQLVAAPDLLRIGGAAALIGFGFFKFVKPRSHPRWVGLRVTPWELTLWSFLMSSAHGAGLMLFPFIVSDASHAHLPVGLTADSIAQNAAAVVVHSAAMLAAMAVVAIVVYEKLGLGVLRKAWLNLDRVWATAVVAAGAVSLFT
jgi:hypothetical protein